MCVGQECTFTLSIALLLCRQLGRQKTVKVYWFQNESDPSLNSNMYEVASEVREKGIDRETETYSERENTQIEIYTEM